ncbi:hypothetical protein F4803DRAFT_513769 [Xylaria telfairii]|nr:hypothetical protein F4803DRAFT_513769 [Xylaria telfairii]
MTSLRAGTIGTSCSVLWALVPSWSQDRPLLVISLNPVSPRPHPSSLIVPSKRAAEKPCLAFWLVCCPSFFPLPAASQFPWRYGSSNQHVPSPKSQVPSPKSHVPIAHHPLRSLFVVPVLPCLPVVYRCSGVEILLASASKPLPTGHLQLIGSPPPDRSIVLESPIPSN